MSQSHTDPELQQILQEHHPQALLKAFKTARDIPLIHLAKQFVTPGIKENPDAKEEKTSQKPFFSNLEPEKYPDLTQEQANSRLGVRPSLQFTEQEKSSFLPWINELLER